MAINSNPTTLLIIWMTNQEMHEHNSFQTLWSISERREKWNDPDGEVTVRHWE
jgi:hypothetical protein